MPIELHNDFGGITLSELQRKKEEGFSVMKTPHVGNQHPSNLVCAALGIHLHMVSFTKGERDTNFHPHLRIENGLTTKLACPTQWTPFAKTSQGTSLEKYHQSAVQKRFANLRISTDIGALCADRMLAEDVMEAATVAMQSLWYRKVTKEGEVHNIHFRDSPTCHHEEILCDVYGFNNPSSGWIVPNKAYLLHDCVVQALESGRDSIYHLSGPQMVGYIGKAIRSVSKAYDLFRQQHPLYGLPEVLHLHVVPVAASRFITHKKRASDLDEVVKVLQWYQTLKNQEKRFAGERFAEVASAFPEFFVPIESASCMSQYDIASADDLYISPWMLQTPINRVQKLYTQFTRHSALAA